MKLTIFSILAPLLVCCGIAGFAEDEIAPLFREAIDIENIILPKSFVKCLEMVL